MKKIAVLLLAVAGIAAIAATCTIKGATVTTVKGKVRYSAEMSNDTNANILKHKFSVGFIKDGALAGTAKTATNCLRSVQSGQSDFFTANSGLAASKVDTAVSRMVGPITFGNTVAGDITVSGITSTRNGELLRVTGKVTNDDVDEMKDIQICVVVRNSDGDITIVGLDDDTFDLKPNKNATFSIDVEVPDKTADVKKVDLWWDALDADDNDKVTDAHSDVDNNVSVCSTATPTTTASSTPTDTATVTPTATATGTLPATATSTPQNACS